MTRANQEENALRESSLETKGKIINFAWQLQINGTSEKTIKTYSKYIQRLANYADINDPEAIKAAIAINFKSRNTKRLVCCAYNAFAKTHKIHWEKPKYKPEHHQVFIPTETELQAAINTGFKINIIFSELLYETGARVNEAERLEWINIDQKRSKITIKASKNGTSRTIKVSKHLIERLLSLPKNQSRLVFPKRSFNARRVAFRYRMKNLARLHDNPRFLEIHYHTFRHCKALREYHKTRDILHVKAVLGHRKIETTMIYVDLYKQIYGNDHRGEFITKIASNKKDRIILMNEGWTLVEKDAEDWYFRRPK
ncbi:MAG: tyrosine-type recombinase/integrase [archaeon]